MKSLVQEVRNAIPKSCVSSDCKGSGCTLKLNGLRPERIIVKMDCSDLQIGDDVARCDYIFFGEQNWVMPIELKGNVDKFSIFDQLNTGAQLAEKFVPNSLKVIFRPVIAHSSTVSRHITNKIKQNHATTRVKFRQENYAVKFIKCGSPLLNAMR